MNKKQIDFLSLSPEQKKKVLDDISGFKDISDPVILEKDFWVSFCLDKIFSSKLKDELIFKGGTSLSKCYGLIDRFSEDVDIGVLPSVIGWDSEKLIEPESNNKKTKQMEALQSDCKNYVETRLKPELEMIFKESLPEGNWELYIDESSMNSGGDLMFKYPKVLTPYPGYIDPVVILEIGSLPEQSPIEDLQTSLLLDTDKFEFTGFESKVRCLSVFRTFWEKATILHRVNNSFLTGKSLNLRYSRHFYDFFKLYISSDVKDSALAEKSTLKDVIRFKTRWFRDPKAKYEEAITGKLSLSPPPSLIPDLESDYKEMRGMFLKPQPAFSDIVTELYKAEKEINTLIISVL